MCENLYFKDEFDRMGSPCLCSSAALLVSSPRELVENRISLFTTLELVKWKSVKLESLRREPAADTGQFPLLRKGPACACPTLSLLLSSSMEETVPLVLQKIEICRRGGLLISFLLWYGPVGVCLYSPANWELHGVVMEEMFLCTYAKSLSDQFEGDDDKLMFDIGGPWRRKTVCICESQSTFGTSVNPALNRLSESTDVTCEPSSCFHIFNFCCCRGGDDPSTTGSVETELWNRLIIPLFLNHDACCVGGFKEARNCTFYGRRMWEFYNWIINNQEISNNSTLHGAPNPGKEIGFFYFEKYPCN